MSSVPEDVYVEILARLPVKSTYVCKCVCKSWFQIISNPSFVEMHLNYAKQRNTSYLLFSTYGWRNDILYPIMNSISYDTLLSSEIKHDDIIQISDTFSFSDSLVGSCNGLVCVWGNSKNFGSIWNPATKEYKKIPTLPNTYESHVRGFGYDHKANDYKVISIVPDVDGSKDSCLVNVYTLRSNQWKRGQNVPYAYSLFVKLNGALVNGALHWFVKTHDENSWSIISFAISEENFNEVPQTKEVLENKQHAAKTIGVLDDCLCVVVKNVVIKVCFEVWVMQKYGVQESWTKRYVISDERIMENRTYLIPMCSFKKGGKILFLWGPCSLVLYDSKHESFKDLDMCGIWCLRGEVSYFESLVSLSSGPYAGGNQEQEEEEEEAD